MFRKVALTVCMIVGCVWCMALESGAANTQSIGAGKFKPVASVGALMHGQLQFFKKISQELTKPANEERNHEIEEYAQILAELANVNRYNSDKQDYVDWATELRDLSLSIAKEAHKKDVDDNKISSLHQQIKGKCGACHDAYQ